LGLEWFYFLACFQTDGKNIVQSFILFNLKIKNIIFLSNWLFFMDLPRRLNATFKATGIKKNDLPEILGVSRGTMFNYLAGKNEPPATFFQAIKNAFPWVNVDWLITGEGEMRISIVAEPGADYLVDRAAINSRTAALLANFEALSEDDKKALERMAFALAESGKKMTREAG
jgi:transcriptional regulator with XRE-family HTH domain